VPEDASIDLEVPKASGHITIISQRTNNKIQALPIVINEDARMVLS
jgi:hypothetical protein